MDLTKAALAGRVAGRVSITKMGLKSYHAKIIKRDIKTQNIRPWTYRVALIGRWLSPRGMFMAGSAQKYA